MAARWSYLLLFTPLFHILNFCGELTGGEGIQCKSSWSPWNWESKEGIEGKGTILFLCYYMYLRLLTSLNFLLLACITWSIFHVLQDHEQALIDAIARLNDLSDGESGTSQFLYLIAILLILCLFLITL